MTATPSDPAASEIERMRHVAAKVVDLWGKPGFGDYVHQLVFDSRDGARKGLPPAAAEELMLLAEVNKDVRAMRLAEKTGLSLRQAYEKIDKDDRAKHHADSLDNPLVSRDTVISRSTPRPRPAPMSAHPGSLSGSADTTPPARRLAAHEAHGLLDVILHLITNKYLVGLVVLAFLAKTFWPSLKPWFGA